MKRRFGVIAENAASIMYNFDKPIVEDNVA